ncbi:MAG: DUF5686 family protein, partial [bacterium]
QLILLEPVVIDMGAVVVTAEDPAVSIMREVIRRKKIWRSKLYSYRVDAFTRQRLENDSSIVVITESISEAFWDRKKGSREVIKSKRQTSNLSQEENFAGASYVSNFYDDDIEIQGFKLIGPTHPKALRYYKFKLEGQRVLDDKIVYDISVTPSTKLQPTFVGRVSVLDEEYALLEVDLKPGEMILYPQPIKEWNLAYQQQFSNFGRDFWLPVDVRINGSIKIGFPGLSFPTIKYHQTSKLTNYEVNIVLPDSLYDEKRLLLVDSTTVKQNSDSVFAASPEVVPLSESEEEAYTELDSTMTMAKAFKPSGPLARFVKIDEDEDGDGSDRDKGSKFPISFRPQLSYNRVDGAHLGLGLRNRPHKNLVLDVSAAYKTFMKEWAYQARARYSFAKHRRGSLELSYRRDTEQRYHSENFSKATTGFLPLFGSDDYFDYYWLEGFRGSIGYRLPRVDLRLSTGIRVEEHSSVTDITSKVLIGSDHVQRPNPAIQAGKLRSIEFTLSYGEDYVPFGLVGQTRAEFNIEHSPLDFLGNEFSFTRYQLSFDGRINTFLKRRFLPNAIDFRIVAGTFTGTLPVQRFGSLDASLGAFDPFGTFKSLGSYPLEGEKYFAVFWEHNFRTVPFEIVGLRGLAKKDLGIIIHGAHGRTWIDEERLPALTYSPRYQDEFRHEIGISLNGIFGLFRLDYTRRLDEPGDFVGFGLKRFF